MSKILMRLRGSKLLSNSWKQELQIEDDGVRGETLKVGKRIKMHIVYENIAQVNIGRGVFGANLEIVNKGGSDNLIIKGLNKKEAEKAKSLIEQKIAEVKSAEGVKGDLSNNNINDLEKLAKLKKKGIVSEEEFNAKKKQILGL